VRAVRLRRSTRIATWRATREAVTLTITANAGATWSLVRRIESSGGWQLYSGRAPAPAAEITMSDDTAWRWFFTTRKDRAVPPSRSRCSSRRRYPASARSCAAAPSPRSDGRAGRRRHPVATTAVRPTLPPSITSRFLRTFPADIDIQQRPLRFALRCPPRRRRPPCRPASRSADWRHPKTPETCLADHPIKGKLDPFLRRGMQLQPAKRAFYSKTKPERCSTRAQNKRCLGVGRITVCPAPAYPSIRVTHLAATHSPTDCRRLSDKLSRLTYDSSAPGAGLSTAINSMYIKHPGAGKSGGSRSNFTI